MPGLGDDDFFFDSRGALAVVRWPEGFEREYHAGLDFDGCSSETMRLITGFSQIASPMPWPYCKAKAASSLGKPNSCALGHTEQFRRWYGPAGLIRWRRQDIAAALIGVDHARATRNRS